MFTRIIFATLFSLAAFDAYAISIANLDSKPHTVTVSGLGNDSRQFVIGPSQVVRCCYGPYVEVEMDGRKQTGEGDYEYTIWPDGQLVLQNRRSFNRSRGF